MAEFNGNGYSISNLHINTIEAKFGVGLFGAIAPNAQLRNVHIRNANITAPASRRVGGLVGSAPDASLGFQSVWDLGGADEYPALTCLPNLTLAEQRIVANAALAGESPVVAYKALDSNE